MRLSIPSHSFRLILPIPLPGPVLTRPPGAIPLILVQATAVSHLSPARGSRWASLLPPASLTLCPLRNNHMLIHMSHRVTPLLKVSPHAHYTQNKSSGPSSVIRDSILSRPVSLIHSSAHISMSHVHSCPKVFLSARTTLPPTSAQRAPPSRMAQASRVQEGLPSYPE